MTVPVGKTTTWTTTAVAILAIITTLGVVWDDLRARLEAAGVPPEWTARAGVVVGLAVVLGRYGQSIAAVWGKSSGPGTVVATTGQGDVQVPAGEAVGAPSLHDGEVLTDPAPTVPSDVPLRDAR